MAAKPLSIRLTDEERATLTERAGDEQLSAYIRRAALGFGALSQENVRLRQMESIAGVGEAVHDLRSEIEKGHGLEQSYPNREDLDPKEREAFIVKRAEELGAEGINPLRIVQLAEAEWDEIQREETE